MYEGKNIHFSPLDNKPLCSYSAKVCKQRRLNGYSLCLRHVLEDPGAPFRQCLYQAKNKQQCTNPIHKNNDAQFCTSHLQLLGLLPVGTKSCSKGNREGKQVKNGHHGGANPVQKDSQRLKTKICDGVAGGPIEVRSVSSDPYKFLDVDPPKSSDSSPPLVSAVTEVGRTPGGTAATDTSGGGKPPVLSEPGRSIPISRLYPELVEKLESNGNRLNSSKPRTGRYVRTVNSLQNRNAPQNRIKLKAGGSSPLSVLLTDGASDSAGLAPALTGTCVASSASSSSSAPLSSSTAATELTSLSNCRINLMDSRTAVTGGSLCGMKNAGLNCNSWMLPVFEPLMAQHSKSQQQQQQPGHAAAVQTLSKTFQGLLNSLPLLNPSLQTHFTVNTLLPCSLNYSPPFRPPPEPSKAPEKGALLNSMPPLTPANIQLPHPLDPKVNGSSSTSGSFISLPMTSDCLPVSETTIAASTAPSSVTSSAAEISTEGVKTTTSAVFENLSGDVGVKEINLVRPKSKACYVLDREAKRRIGRKRAWKIYVEHASRVTENTNLLPTGVDSSDDDDDGDDDGLDDRLPWQRVWNDLSSDEGDRDFDLAEDVASNIRRTKLQLLKSKLRRQFVQLQKCHEGNAGIRWRHNAAIGRLVASCREDSTATVEALRSIRSMKSGNSLPSRSNEVTRLEKRPCLHQSDSDVACKSVALPYTNHCIKHIMYNVDQMLFGYCTAKSADRTQCCVPVFDIQHELPLCSDHINRDFGVRENQESKPKKQRKKTKPSALTRPPKKGKKKKCQRKSTQNSQKLARGFGDCLGGSDMTTSEADDALQQPVDVASASSATVAPAALGLPSSVAAISSTLLGGGDVLSKDSIEDDALGSDLDVPFSPSGIPLDNDPTSNFLDDHELHEMLNKIADEAFDLSSAGKNGGYTSSKEAEEEFVRAFAEVTKTLNDGKRTRLDPMTHDHSGLATLLHDGAHEDELTKQIADSLLGRSALSPNGSVSDDQDNLGDLASSLTVHDLKSISQAMLMGHHALDLCPTAIALQPTTGDDRRLLPPIFPHKHPFETVSTGDGLRPVGRTLTDSRVCASGILAFPQTANGTIGNCALSQHPPLKIVPSVSVSPSLPSLLSTVLPLAIGASGTQVVDGTTVSRTARPARAGDDGSVQPFQTLPDIQTLMRQPWRLNEDAHLSEFPANSVTLSSLAAAVGFHGNPFSFLPNFNPSQLLASESKVSCTILPKIEPENVESVLMPAETNAAVGALETSSSRGYPLSSGAVSQSSSSQKILNQKPTL